MTGSHRSEDARFKLAPLSCRYPHRHGYSAPLASFSGNRGNATRVNESISASRASLREVDLNQVQAASFADALDGVSASVFFVDAHARVAHANIAGHAMLEAGDVLCSVDGRLVAIDAQIDQILREAFIAAAGGDGALGIKGVAIPLTAQNGEHYTAHLLPLTSGERGHAGRNSCATAALFVRKAALTTPSPPEVIAKSYRLTPTELRVLLAVVDVGGASEVAEALGVAESTVRSHIRRLFEKTGAARNADLVKLVASFSSPLAV